MHIAALILGILGLILCWWPFVGWVGVLLALIAVILGVVLLVKKDTGNKTFGIIGLVLGGIALIGGLIVQVVLGVLLSAGLDEVDEWQVQNQDIQAQQQPFE